MTNNHDRTVPEIAVPIPDLEAAGKEYLMDFAFDERMEHLLGRSQHDMLRFTLDTETLIQIDSDYLRHSHSYDSDGTEQPTTRVKIDGYDYKGQDGLGFQARFIPDVYYGDVTTLSRVDSNSFKLQKGDAEKSLTPIEATGLIMRSTGTDSSHLDALVQKHIIDQSMCGELITRSIRAMAEVRGSWNRERTTEIAARESTIDKPVRIRLGYVEGEGPAASTLKVVLEKAILHMTLNAEEVYRLVLHFSNEHIDTSSEPNLITAEKSVRGDGFTLQSADFVHKDTYGKPTPLDYNDPAVATLFVDAYEELVDSIPAWSNL